MRTTDQPENTPALGPLVKPQAPAAKQTEQTWTPITSQPGYQRSSDGQVRKIGCTVYDGMPWGMTEFL